MLFVTLHNDGYELGAQRRAHDKNDLPQALTLLQHWQQTQRLEPTPLAHSVSKADIAKDPAYPLNGERYRPAVDYTHAKWPMVALGEVCEVKRGQSITKKQVAKGNIPVIAGGQQPAYYHNQANREGKVITISGSGAYAGFVNFFTTPIFASDCSTIQTTHPDLIIEYVYYVLKAIQDRIYALRTGMAQPHVYPKNIQTLKIPLPPLAVQGKIVEKIEELQKNIDSSKKQIKMYEQSIAETVSKVWGEPKMIS